MPTLSDNSLFKIRSLVSGKVITYAGVDDVSVCTDVNDDGQLWYAERVYGDDWRLRCMRRLSGAPKGSHVFLACKKLARQQFVWDLEGEYDKWTITQWKTRGGAEYRLWLSGASEAAVLDLVRGSTLENTNVCVWEPTEKVNQLWLFEVVPKPRYDA